MLQRMIEPKKNDDLKRTDLNMELFIFFCVYILHNGYLIIAPNFSIQLFFPFTIHYYFVLKIYLRADEKEIHLVK